MAGWIIESQHVEALVAGIIQANCTNNYGDGKVFVCPVDEVTSDEIGTVEIGTVKHEA